jgi:hypothetical protein
MLRAIAWLQVNSGRCHRLEGPAKKIGLHLLASTGSPSAFVFRRVPVAAERSPDGRNYDILHWLS